MIDFRPVNAILGILIIILGAMMLVPALFDILQGHRDWLVFAASSGLTLFVGTCLWLTGREAEVSKLSVRQAFLITGLSWILLSGFGGIPFMWGEPRLNFTRAYFETMSGLTTTGATLISGLDTMPPGILLWRSLLHWYGGVGIIVVAIAILPLLQVGGMAIFRTESSDKSDKVAPRVAEVANGILLAYGLLTLAVAIAYWLAGMTPFDAVNHAMSALSTGGFSTKDSSIGAWASPAVDYVSIAGMFAGALPMVLYVRALRGNPGAFLTNPEIRVFVLIIAAFTLASTLQQIMAGINSGETAFRYALFNVVSLITTTGMITADYTNWGAFSDVLYFIVLFLGGCTGSTSGGLKSFRIAILSIATLHQFEKVIHPHGVKPMRYGSERVDDDVVSAVFAFVFVYAAWFLITATALSLVGYDLRTSMSASIAALANVGPGLGPLVGPAVNWSGLDDLSIWILTVAMLLGRLEFFTILVLLLPRFWRG